jgi:signal transduction histidine kinase
VGRPAREVASYPGDESRLRLEAELLDTGRTRIEFTAVRMDGCPVEVELVALAVKDERGTITGYLGIHRDISERRRTHAELEQRLRQQAAVADLGLAALATTDLPAVLERATVLVARTLDVEYASVEQLLPDRERLLVSAGAGWPAGIVGNALLPAARGSPAGYALLTRRPVIVDDIAVEPRFAVPRMLREHGVKSEAIVVIGLLGDSLGTLSALSKNGRTFTAHDVSFMQSVANVLATVAERASMDRRLEAARRAERTRISRELHDGALRELTEALGVATLARSNSAAPRSEPRWAELMAILQRLGQQLRGAVYDLRLGTDEHRGFAPLMDDLVAVQSELAVDCRVQLERSERLPAGSLGHRGTEVLRIVREAITNARLHSGATVIHVDADGATEALLRLVISDDGAWPDRPTEVSRGCGAGIMGMFERADELGAALRIEGRVGGGTSVSLELPLAGHGPDLDLAA